MVSRRLFLRHSIAFVLAAFAGSAGRALAANSDISTANALNVLPDTTPTPSAAAVAASTASHGACLVEPIGMPTTPSWIPKYPGEQDPSTGLHVTGKYQLIDPATYRLNITGKVAQPLTFTYDELRCLPKVGAQQVLDCVTGFTDIAVWSGTPLAPLLERAQVLPDAKDVLLISAGGYKTTVSLAVARAPESYLAYELNGQTLPVLHGFPLRAVFPGQDGFRWSKWLVEIQIR